MADRASLERALRAADAAGDVDAAQKLARALRTEIERGGRRRGMAEGLRSFAAQRTIPRPAEDARDAELRERIVTRAEQADAGMSDTEASLRNFMPQAEMFFRNPVRGLSDVGEAAIDMTANLGAEVLERPVETLTYPLTAPSRAVQEYTGRDPFMRKVRPGFGEEVVAGRAGHAIDRALGATTAAGETALLATPMRTGAPRPAPQPGRMQAAVQDFQRSNIEPFAAGVAAETPAGAGFGRVTQVTGENVLAGLPVRGAMARRMRQAERQSEQLADRFSPARTPEEGGDAVRRGVTELSRRVFPQEAERRYAAVNAQLNRGRFTSTQSARATLDTINNRFSRASLAELFRNPRLQRLQEALQTSPTGTSLHYRDLRELRSEVRRMRTDQGLMRDVRDADLAQLERALTADIYRGIRAAIRDTRTGGQAGAAARAQQALADLQATDRWYRETATIIREDLERFATDTAEGAFRQARTASRGGGAGAINSLRELMHALDAVDPALRRDLSATILRDMASRGRDGGFSPATWARAWEQMSPEAKDILFGQGGAAARENLEAFYRTMRRMREAERYTNFSNTFAAGQTMATGASLVAAPVPSMLLHAAWASGGALLMSPNFTRLLAQAGQASARGANAAELYGRQYAVLTALPELEPELAADYRRLLELLPPPGAGGSARMPTPALPAPAPALPPPP